MRHKAVFCIVQNEPVFLPIWLRYYRRYFSADDIYVLDHDTTDHSTDNLGVNRVKVHNKYSFDHKWLRQTVMDFQQQLFKTYENVLFTEVDEIIATDPVHVPDLGTYIDRFKNQAICCSGYEIVHDREVEPKIDFNRPLLKQRLFFYSIQSLCKPLLSKVPLRWKVGFHRAKGVKLISRELLLLHLHQIDYSYCLERHRANAARRWSKEEIARGTGEHNRITGDKEFNNWFYGRLRAHGRSNIPEHLKSII